MKLRHSVYRNLFPIQSISFSQLFSLVQTKHHWIQWEKLKCATQVDSDIDVSKLILFNK